MGSPPVFVEAHNLWLSQLGVMIGCSSFFGIGISENDGRLELGRIQGTDWDEDPKDRIAQQNSSAFGIQLDKDTEFFREIP